MKRIFYSLFLALAFVQFSCTKEELPPLNETEQTAAFLKELIQKESVERVIPFERADAGFSNTIIIGDYGRNYKLESPFFILGNKAWNLKNLRKYDLQKIDNIQTLGLYFY